MSDIAIRVESLSKAYRIGLQEQQHETMLGAMAAWVKAPLSRNDSVEPSFFYVFPRFML